MQKHNNKLIYKKKKKKKRGGGGKKNKKGWVGRGQTQLTAAVATDERTHLEQITESKFKKKNSEPTKTKTTRERERRSQRVFIIWDLPHAEFQI